jgi:hypothetical protein
MSRIPGEIDMILKSGIYLARRVCVALAVSGLVATGAVALAQDAAQPLEVAHAGEGGDYGYALRLESANALFNARNHYRRGETREAVNELRKVMSWVQTAAGEMQLPGPRARLDDAAGGLARLAGELEAGRLVEPADVDTELSRTSQGLAEFHYYRARARETSDAEDARYAARELVMAATYLMQAATMSHYQYDPDTMTMFEEVRRDGRLAAQQGRVESERLGRHLDAVAVAIREIGNAPRGPD